MKSKEAIRNQIIHYANVVWGTKNTNNFNSLIHLMIEEVCNELYLLDNKLNDIDSTILERLVKDLAPSMYNYVRPAHGILQIKPNIPVHQLSKKTDFFLKVVPNYIKNKNIASVVFTPIVDLTVLNVRITNIFHNKTLWSMDDAGNRFVSANTDNEAKYNTVWLKLNVGEGVKYFKDLFFYFDFPHLNDNHDYYNILSDIKWTLNGKPLKVKQGLPLLPDEVPSRVENDLLDFYKDHYQTIENTLLLNEIPQQSIPEELADIIPEKVAASIADGYWFRVSFPPHFDQNDLDKMIVALNAFPILNRQYNDIRLKEKNLANVVSLSSKIGEDFLEMDTVFDSRNTIYTYHDSANNTTGTYTVEPIQKKRIDDPRIADYLERLIDIAQDEKTAFPEIDSEKIVEVLNSISAIQNKETHKVILNHLNDLAEAAKLSINSQENITSLNISYWTTHVDLLNDLPEGTSMMANKVPVLNGSDAVLLTTVGGGRSFYDIDSLKAINRFFLTAKDRILTKHDITSFCRIELNGYIKDVDVIRKAKISSKYKEGIINVMEIQITPKEEHVEYLNRKGVLKDLLVRMRRRSPNDYHYTTNILLH